MALGSNKSWDDWIEEYAQSHQNPINRFCHYIGIPMIVLSLIFLPICFRFPPFWRFTIAFFILGWLFQFIGHLFERKPPEFFKDWRFLLVGTRWWAKKVFNKGKQGKE